MKKQIEAVLILHVINYVDSTKEKMLTALQEKLSCRKRVSVFFVHAEQYWKIPEHTRCVFKLVFESDDESLIEELPCFLGVKKFSLLGENNVVIWDKKTHGGVFLNENIEWVHAYLGDE
ncbi:hypothetical protein KKA53_04170 [Candidatus Dependentiae bacterium]|nr:hypothetical protein [Candidatus Dependentiae bacterium]